MRRLWSALSSLWRLPLSVGQIEPLQIVRPLPGGPPPLGLTLPCRVAEWKDGDTVRVEIRLAASVRLAGVWSPEVHTKDPQEKARGEAARRFVQSRWPIGTELVLHVPATGARELGDVLTLDRLLGQLWSLAGEDVGAKIVAAGHATREKA